MHRRLIIVTGIVHHPSIRLVTKTRALLRFRYHRGPYALDVTDVLQPHNQYARLRRFRSSWIRTNTISAIYHRSSLPIELLSDETGLLLEAKKPLERTPHFFEPGVGECVNALGQLVDLKGFEPLNPKVFELKSNAFSNFTTDPSTYMNVGLSRLSEFPVLIDAKSATLTKKRWCFRTELNRRPGDFQSPTLPSELPKQIARLSEPSSV